MTNVENSLALAPFNLSAEDIAWVRKTRDGLSTDAKIRQLFVHITVGDDLVQARKIAATKPGGIHRFMGPSVDEGWAATRLMLELNEVPLLITGDLEGGGHLSGAMTAFTNQLGLAAANDPQLSARVLSVLCDEAKAMGYNWSFTPVVDVNKETGSAIVGTRSYGSDIEKIIAQARAHVKTLQAHGIAGTAKHWPGEGFDSRDQHLVTTINPLGLEAWHDIFGRIYKTMIDDGVMTVMSAHIALPSYMASKGVPAGLERYRPASASKLLNMDLLRGELGFNGLIVSDATPMAGLGSWQARDISVPEVIENGCDMFLFCEDPDKDHQMMTQGLRDKRLSEQRLEDAVTRILGLKAALGLHKKSIDERLPPLAAAKAKIGSAAHSKTSAEATARSITLVKDTQKLLPLDTKRHKRVVLIDRGVAGMFPGQPRKHLTAFAADLKARGFELRDYDSTNPPTRENTDLLIHVFAVESSFGLSQIYIDWKTEHPGMLSLLARYWHEVPTLMVSFGHPYYLRDAPRVPTYINAYTTIEAAQHAVVERLMGDAPFTGENPVDPFAGAPDAQY